MMTINRRRKKRGAAAFLSLLGQLAETRLSISTFLALAAATTLACAILGKLWGIPLW